MIPSAGNNVFTQVFPAHEVEVCIFEQHFSRAQNFLAFADTLDFPFAMTLAFAGCFFS